MSIIKTDGIIDGEYVDEEAIQKYTGGFGPGVPPTPDEWNAKLEESNDARTVNDREYWIAKAESEDLANQLWLMSLDNDVAIPPSIFPPILKTFIGVPFVTWIFVVTSKLTPDWFVVVYLMIVGALLSTSWDDVVEIYEFRK